MTQLNARLRSQRRVVCAAIRKQEFIVLGARHFDATMHEQIRRLAPLNMSDAEQGFIDQHGVFMTRKEAFKVAKAAKQILFKTGNPKSKELFSEDIYGIM